MTETMTLDEDTISNPVGADSSGCSAIVEASTAELVSVLPNAASVPVAYRSLLDPEDTELELVTDDVATLSSLLKLVVLVKLTSMLPVDCRLLSPLELDDMVSEMMLVLGISPGFVDELSHDEV